MFCRRRGRRMPGRVRLGGTPTSGSSHHPRGSSCRHRSSIRSRTRGAGSSPPAMASRSASTSRTGSGARARILAGTSALMSARSACSHIGRRLARRTCDGPRRGLRRILRCRSIGHPKWQAGLSRRKGSSRHRSHSRSSRSSEERRVYRLLWWTSGQGP